MVSPSFPQPSISREGGFPESVTGATLNSVPDELMLKAVCPLHCPSQSPDFAGAAAVVGDRAVVGDGDDVQTSHRQPLDGSLQRDSR